jgi:glycosyltransferase involved in cell wall biosynthesis
VRVTIVGADPVARVAALAEADARVQVTGRVDDVRPYLHRATLAACPLVYAAGIQNKVLEAMACETPVIASPVACEGLSAQPGEDLERAGEITDFARVVVRLLGDPEGRARLGAGGRHYVETHHDWNWVVARLEELYQSALARYREHPSREGVRGQR